MSIAIGGDFDKDEQQQLVAPPASRRRAAATGAGPTEEREVSTRALGLLALCALGVVGYSIFRDHSPTLLDVADARCHNSLISKHLHCVHHGLGQPRGDLSSLRQWHNNIIEKMLDSPSDSISSDDWHSDENESSSAADARDAAALHDKAALKHDFDVERAFEVEPEPGSDSSDSSDGSDESESSEVADARDAAALHNKAALHIELQHVLNLEEERDEPVLKALVLMVVGIMIVGGLRAHRLACFARDKCCSVRVSDAVRRGGAPGDDDREHSISRRRIDWFDLRL